MRLQYTIDIALENLQRDTQIQGSWKESKIEELDGKLTLNVNNRGIIFNIAIRQELRSHQLPQIMELAAKHEPFMLVARRILPSIKDILREKDIAYLEANGNIYFKNNNAWLWIDANKPMSPHKEKGNRAFTKTGLKVVFHFLLDENLINLPYREIAKKVGVGLGNINYVINGLKELGFLISLNKNKYVLDNKKDLLHKWMIAYEERLKPTLAMGTFSFVQPEEFRNWKNLPLTEAKTWWGGEAAGDLYTSYLRPEELILYTLETRLELIKNYRLVPHEKGTVKVYRKFWQYEKDNNNIVPPILAYADLMGTGNDRCIETAQKLYNGFIKQIL